MADKLDQVIYSHTQQKIKQEDLNGRKIKLKAETETIFAIADSASSTSFSNEKSASAFAK